jgi:hypothetical protein
MPRLEALEARCCPSTATVQGSTLYIIGDNLNNVVTITDNGNGQITGSIDGQVTTGLGITKVVVNTKGGDDTLNYTLANQLVTPLTLKIDMGNGYNQANLSFLPGVVSPSLTVNVNGGPGTDHVTAAFGSIFNTRLVFNTNLGQGQDTFDGTLAGDLLGRANVQFNVAARGGGLHIGGDGGGSERVAHLGNNDVIALHALGVNIASRAQLALNVSGGLGADDIALDYQGQVNGALKVLASGGRGDDTVAANLTIDYGSTGSLNADVQGNKGNDDLTLNVYDNSGTGGASSLKTLKAFLEPGTGTDTLTFTDNVKVVHFIPHHNNNDG